MDSWSEAIGSRTASMIMFGSTLPKTCFCDGSGTRTELGKGPPHWKWIGFMEISLEREKGPTGSGLYTHLQINSNLEKTARQPQICPEMPVFSIRAKIPAWTSYHATPYSWKDSERRISFRCESPRPERSTGPCARPYGHRHRLGRGNRLLCRIVSSPRESKKVPPQPVSGNNGTYGGPKSVAQTVTRPLRISHARSSHRLWESGLPLAAERRHNDLNVGCVRFLKGEKPSMQRVSYSP